MTILVAYDSAYGNTAKIAHAIGEGLSGIAEVRQIRELDPQQLPAFDLLIIGCPTQGGRPTAAMTAWIDRLPAEVMAGKKVATFDTRLTGEKSAFLRFLMTTIGYAAPRLERVLRTKGVDIVGGPEGFIVTGREGPLRAGEIERAGDWGNAVATTARLFALAQ